MGFGRQINGGLIMDILTVESDIVELVEEGALSWEAVARAGLRWISS